MAHAPHRLPGIKFETNHLFGAMHVCRFLQYPNCDRRHQRTGKIVGSAPTIFGTAPAGSSVSVYDHGKLIGTTTASYDGEWILLSSPLSAGLYGYTAVSKGVMGDQKSNVATFTITNNQVGYKFAIKSFENTSVSVANQAKVQLVFDAVASAFSTVFNGNKVVPIDVTVVTTSAYAASAGSSFMKRLIDEQPSMFSSNMIISDVISLATGESTNLSHQDFSIASHEIMHLMGFESRMDVNGVSFGNWSDGTPFGVMDRYLTSVNGSLYFIGPNAVAINGGPVKLYDSAHLADLDDVMSPMAGSHGSVLLSPTNETFPFSKLNIAIFKDLGYSNKYAIASHSGTTFITSDGQPGHNSVKGTAATDTLLVTKNRGDFTITKSADGFSVKDTAGTTGTQEVTSIERVQFKDMSVALDIDGIGGQAYRLYRAAFDRTPDKAGVGFWLKQMDGGLSLKDAAANFVTSAEFISLYGATPTNAQLVTRLYENILDRAPEKAGFDFWMSILDTKQATITDMLYSFSESRENQDAVAAIIGQGFEYLPWGGG